VKAERLEARLAQAGYQVTLTLSVSDAGALWAAAANRGLTVPGATIEDLEDVIGPREDPSIEACIAMLAGPTAVAGCALENFEVEELSALCRAA